MVSFIDNQKAQYNKLVQFVRNPARFFAKNRDGNEALVDFATFIARISIIVNFLIINTLFYQQSVIFAIIFSIVLLLIARPLNRLGLWFFSIITNFFVWLVARKSDRLVAKRVLAYAGAGALIPRLPILAIFATLVPLVLTVVGLVKQYKVSWAKAILAEIIELALFAAIGIILFRLIGLPQGQSVTQLLMQSYLGIR